MSNISHQLTNKNVATQPSRGTLVCSAGSGSEYLRVGREVGANSSST